MYTLQKYQACQKPDIKWGGQIIETHQQITQTLELLDRNCKIIGINMFHKIDNLIKNFTVELASI
jgi:hypothetical protein